MQRLMLVVAMVVATTIGFSPSASAVTYETAPSFCGARVLRDYLAPLRHLPKLRSPAAGRVGFGSSNLLIKTTHHLIVGGGDVGYWLYLRDEIHAVHPDRTLTATLTRVNSRGRAVEMVGRARRHIGTVTPSNYPGSYFEVGDEPAMYRLIVAFQNEAGDKLGYYGFYYRVVAPVDDIRLSLNAGSYYPEQTVFALIENFGTTHVQYGASYSIQRLEGSVWKTAPESPRRFIKPLYHT